MNGIDWPMLRRAAVEAMGRAYAPYSQFPVGASPGDAQARQLS